MTRVLRLLPLFLLGLAVPANLRAEGPSEKLPAHAVRKLLAAEKPLPVHAVAITPDGKVAASAGADGAIRLWDLTSGKLTKTLKGHEETVRSLCFSADGVRLASGGKDGSVRMWGVGDGKELWKILAHPGETHAVAIAPDGNSVASAGGEKSVRLWNVDDGKALLRFDGLRQPAFAVAFAPPGKTLAAGGRDRTIAEWDVKTGKILRQMKGHKSWVLALAFATEGPTLISAGRDQTIRLWDEWNGKTFRRLGGWDGEVLSLALARKGRLLASGDANSMIRFRDARSGKEIAHWAGHTDAVTCLAADGDVLVSGSLDGSVIVWNLKDIAETPEKPAPLTAQETETLWATLTGDDEEPDVYAAMRRMIGTPAEALPFLKKQVKPVPADEQARVAILISTLNDDSFAERERAVAELMKRGQFAVPAIERTLQGKLDSLEVRRRMERILMALPVEQLRRERERERRVLEILERMNTSEARHHVEALAKGAADAALTGDARATLQRMDQRKGK